MSRDVQQAGHRQQDPVFGLRNAAAGEGGFDQNFHEHLAKVAASHGKFDEGAHGSLEVEIRLLALVEKPDGPLPLLPADLHALHQCLHHANLGLRHAAVRLAEMAQTGEEGLEKGFPGRPHADDSGQEPVHEVAQQGADHGAADPAPEQADEAADDLAPPVPGYAERTSRHGLPVS